MINLQTRSLIQTPHHVFSGHPRSWRNTLPTCFYLELAEQFETDKECILYSLEILVEAAAEVPSCFVEADPSYLDSRLPSCQGSFGLAEKSFVADRYSSCYYCSAFGQNPGTSFPFAVPFAAAQMTSCWVVPSVQTTCWDFPVETAAASVALALGLTSISKATLWVDLLVQSPGPDLDQVDSTTIFLPTEAVAEVGQLRVPSHCPAPE